MGVRRSELEKALAYAVSQAFGEVGVEGLVGAFPSKFVDERGNGKLVRKLGEAAPGLTVANCVAELAKIVEELGVGEKLDLLDELGGQPRVEGKELPAWQTQAEPLSAEQAARIRAYRAKLAELAELDDVLAGESAKTASLRAELEAERARVEALEHAVEQSQAFADDLAAQVAPLAQVNPLTLELLRNS